MSNKLIASLMNDRGLINVVLKAVLNQNGFESIEGLSQRDYEWISNELFEKTNVSLSVSTIKRLLKGQFGKMPQTATLNAFATYLGYVDWRELKRKYQFEESDGRYTEKGTNKIESLKTWVFKKSKVITKHAVIIVGLLALLCLLYFIPSNSSLKEAKFSLNRATKTDIPNTVIFYYDMGNIKADSFYIQQSWDGRKRVNIDPKKHILTDIYYEPGYHIAKLIADDKIVKTIDVHIPTGGWFYYSQLANSSSPPKYIKTKKSASNGQMAIGLEDLKTALVDTENEQKISYCLFPEELKVSSENCIFKTRVKLLPIVNVPCNYIALEIFTQRRFLFFKVVPKGCSNEALVVVGEKNISGKISDLSEMGSTLTDWMDVEIRIVNKLAKLLINNKLVFQQAYKEPTKLITGLGFISNGICQVDKVSLYGGDSSLVYDKDFE